MRLIRVLFVAFVFQFQVSAAERNQSKEASSLAQITNSVARKIVEQSGRKDIHNAHLLAFKSKVDERPLYVDSALVLLQLKRQNYWELWSMACNPMLNGKLNPAAKWSQYTITDSTQRGSKWFDHKPTEKDVEDFLRLSEWSFTVEPTWKLLQGHIDKEIWQTVLGFVPKYRFQSIPAQKEK